MNKQEQTVMEMSLLNDVKGEAPSPFNNFSEIEKEDTILLVQKYIQDHYPQEYMENEKRFSLMLNELFPLSIRRLVEWGDISLKQQKDVFQNTTLLIKDFSSLKAADIIDELQSISPERAPK